MSKTPSAKELLRQAKISIDAGDWQTGSKTCARLLKQEADNYMGWVFMGLCMDNLNDKEKAIQSYKKAILIQKTQATAWQGLVKVLTDIGAQRTPSQNETLLDALENTIALLPDDHVKKLGLIQQKSELLEQSSQLLPAAEELKKAAKLKQLQENKEELLKTLEKIIDLYLREESQNKKNDEAYHKTVNEEIFAILETFRELGSNFVGKYIDRIKFDANTEEAVAKSEHLIETYPDCYQPLEYMIDFYQTDTLRENKIKTKYTEKELVEKLKTQFPERPLAKVHAAIDLRENPETLKTVIIQELDKAMRFFSNGKGWKVIAELSYELKATNNLFDYISKGLEYIKKITEIFNNPHWQFIWLRGELLSLLAKYYFLMKKVNEAKTIYKRIIDNSPGKLEILLDANQNLAFIYFNEANYADASTYFTNLLNLNPNSHLPTAYLGRIDYFNKNYEEAINKLKKALELQKESVYYYWLAESYWEFGQSEEKSLYRKDKQFTLTNLLQGARLNAQDGNIFASLGRYYQYIENDIEKAKKCYQKALSHLPLQELASRELADIYEKEKNFQEVKKIYEQITSLSGSNNYPPATPGHLVWAWSKLGTLQFTQFGNYEDAASCFKNLLRLNDSHHDSLFALGECYYHQQMLMAALRVYQKYLSVYPNSIPAHCRISSIQHQLGLYEEAIGGYLKVLELDEANEKGIEGISYSYYELAKKQITEGFYYRSGATITSAIQYLSKLSNKFTVELHQLAGDILNYSYQLPEEYLIPVYSNDLIHCDPILYHSLQFTYLQHAEKSYKNALNMKDNQSLDYLHYDLAINYWYQYNTITLQLLNNKSNAPSFPELNSLKDQLKCQYIHNFKEAIRLNPKNIIYWNALGIVEEKYSVKQHLFIRAIEIQPDHPESWCNLMAFYIENQQYNLADQCFQQILVIDPDYHRAWLNNSLLKEIQFQNDKISKENLLDFYISSFQLYPQSTFIKQSIAILSDHPDVGLYYLINSIEQDPSNDTFWNLLGLFYEELQLLDSSIYCFEKAADIFLSTKNIQLISRVSSSTNPGDTNFILGSQNPGAELNIGGFGFEYLIDKSNDKNSQNSFQQRNFENLIKCKLNQARILCKLQRYSESVAIYNELMKLAIDIREQFGFYCLSLFKSGSQADSFKVFQYWLDHAEPSYKQFILHQFCRFAVAHGDFVMAKSKIDLFSAFQSVESWRMIVVTGIQLKEEEFALKYIHLLKNSPNHKIEDLLLEVSLFLRLQKFDQAKKAFNSAIHAFPSDKHLKFQFLEFLVHHFPADCYAVSQFIWSNTPDPLSASSSDERSDQWVTLAKALLVIGKTRKYSAKDVLERCRRNIKEALHLNPNNLSARYISCYVSYLFYFFSLSSSPSKAYHLSSLLKTLSFLQASGSFDKSLLVEVQLMAIQCLLCEKYSLPKLNGLFSDFNESQATDFQKLVFFTFKNKFLLISSEKNAKETEEEIVKKENEIAQSPSPDALFYFYFYAVDFYLLQNQVGKAVEYFVKILGIKNMAQDDFAYALSQLAFIQIQMNNFKDAIGMADKACLVTGRRTDGYLLLKSLIHFHMKDWKRAIPVLERCVAFNPRIIYANYMLMQIHIQSNQISEAESDALYEIDNFPTLDLPYLLLGYLVYTAATKNKNLKKVAIKWLSLGKHLNPTRPSYTLLKVALSKIR